MKSFLLRLVSDDKGNISSQRFINLLIGVSSCLLVWKMVLMGGMTDTMWGLWLAYGVGGAGWGKYVENKPPKPKPEPEPYQMHVPNEAPKPTSQ